MENKTSNKTSWNNIRAEFWPEGESDPTLDPSYTLWDIDESDGTPSSTRLNAGRVGIVTDSGSGTKFWGPITIVSNVPPTGANLAYEDFRGDTIVDIKPYTPVNWYPRYDGVEQFVIGKDTTGFLFDKSGGDTALIYRHKAGAEYPVRCRVVPYTNLEWKDYVFSGSIVKPAGSMYDSVDVGLEFYRTDANNTYRLTFASDGVYLNGGKYSNQNIYPTRFFSGGDSLHFKISVISQTKNEVADSSIYILIQANTNGGSSKDLIEGYDVSVNRLKKGEAGINVDMSGVQDRANLQPIKISNIVIAKSE